MHVTESTLILIHETIMIPESEIHGLNWL